MFVSVFLSKFVAVAKILLELSIIEGIALLGEGDFAKQFCFKLDVVTKVIAGDGDSLGANLDERSIVIIVNPEKNVI